MEGNTEARPFKAADGNKSFINQLAYLKVKSMPKFTNRLKANAAFLFLELVSRFRYLPTLKSTRVLITIRDRYSIFQ
tara:strand:+ start:299 stop:529 length:231 start_codon:yes stop_codon:yes gene_type:complete